MLQTLGRFWKFIHRCTMGLNTKVHQEPIATFGVLADVQYADCENKPAPCESSKTRYYRGALAQVDEAFKYWKNSGLNVKFVLQLGDIIDGLNRFNNNSQTGLSETLSHFENHPDIPTFHTVGNHELYNFSKKELAFLFYNSIMKLKISPEVFIPLEPEDSCSQSSPTLYYKFSPVPQLKCISLDCFDISVLGYGEEDLKYQEASKLLSLKHGHSVFEDWDCNGPLQGLDVRFQQMNGALSEEQLRWLDQELKESDGLAQKVIVFGHVSLNPDSSDWSCLLWNYEKVIEVFHHHRCVVAYLNGHTHESGYALDSHGISYISFAGIVETPPDTTAFATVSVYEDKLEVKGHGIEKSYVVPYSLATASVQNPVESEVDVSSSTVKVQVG